MNKLKELEKNIATGKRRCVCTEEYYCRTCKEMERLKNEIY